jgi:hypothetical protein
VMPSDGEGLNGSSPSNTPLNPLVFPNVGTEPILAGHGMGLPLSRIYARLGAARGDNVKGVKAALGQWRGRGGGQHAIGECPLIACPSRCMLSVVC